MSKGRTNYQKAIGKLLVILALSFCCQADNGKNYFSGRPHVSNFKKDPSVKTTDIANLDNSFNQYTFGVDWNATTGQGNSTLGTKPDMFQLGLDVSVNFDISLGYKVMFFQMFRNDNSWLVINPQVFAEVATHNWIGIKLGVLEVYINIDGTGYRATPVEYQASWNLNKPAQYCHTMGFLQEVFDIAVRAELYVNECFFGPFGFLSSPSNPLDCWRRRYYPKLPIWSLDGFPEWNMWIEYFEWSCNYEGDDVIANSQKREPNNVDDGTKEQAKTSDDVDGFEEPNNLPGDEDEQEITEFKKIKSPIKELVKPDHFIVMN